MVRPWRAAAIAAMLAVLGTGGAVIWRAKWSLADAVRQAAAENRIEADLTPLEPLRAGDVSLIPAAASLSCAAVFQGRLYAGGVGGLVAFDENGAVAARYRPGFELPPAPVTAMVVANLAGSSFPELILATGGAGLIRFDGRRFMQAAPREAALRKLTALTPASGGAVLAGTAAHGVLRFDGERFDWFHASLRGHAVTTLLSAGEDLWVGTAENGLLRWSAGRLESFTEADGLPDARVLSLAQHGDAVLAGTPAGVAQFWDGRLERTLMPGVFARAVHSNGGVVYVGTVDEGVHQFGRRGAVEPEGPPDVRAIFRHGSSVMAVAAGGLHVFQHGAWRRFSGEDSFVLSDAHISALAADSAGRLWVGYFDRGLDVLNADHTRMLHYEREPVYCVNRILPDPRTHSVAVATANGLAWFDSSARLVQVLTRANGLIATHVTDVALTPDGMVAATPAGLTFLDRAGPRSLYAFHGLVNNHVYTLAASGSRLLAGTLGGLSVLDGDLIRANYHNANSPLARNWITALADVGDSWMVGTYGGSVWEFDGSGRWERSAGLPDGLVVNPNAMAVTPRRVYAGLLDRGLAVFDRRARRWTIHERGLPSRDVTAIVASAGRLYIGTSNGLVQTTEDAIRVP